MFTLDMDEERAGALFSGKNIKLNPKNASKDSGVELSHSKLDQCTRYPISIFRQIKKVKDEKQKMEFEGLLSELRNTLPAGYKIGASICGGDCFFDSMAQSLNELKKKRTITSSKNFNAKLLREDCATYASNYREYIINDAKGGDYFVQQKNYVDSHLGTIKERKRRHNAPDEDKTFDSYLESITKTSEEVEYPIWGRPEIEGKMICKKYGVKVKIIELRNEEMDGLHVIKSKVGKGNNIIYLGNYENHFVPLLSDIEKDIKRKINISREEVHGNVVDSNSSNNFQSYISISLQDIENSSDKQSSHPRSPTESSKIRKRAVTSKDERVSKRLRYEASEFYSDLPDESKEDLSNELGPIIDRVNKKLLEDKNEEIKFAKSVVGKEGTPVFDQFLDFLIKEEKLEALKRNGINPVNMSRILNRAGGYAAKAFKDLYDLWLDVEGNKTKYIKSLEEEGISLASMSSFLGRAGGNSAKAFKELYDLWFDEEGNKTRYLKTLEEKGISLANMSSILGGGRANAPKAFKDLYDLWFDEEGNKTQYLKTLENEGINISNMSSILNGAGVHAAKAFKDLYNTFFCDQGGKTLYLKTLEKEGVNLANMSSILNGVGANAVKAFKDLYDLWFDKEGNKTKYLKTLEKEGVNLANMSSIISRAGMKAPKAFKSLYDLWFDKQGNKTQYLETLEKEGINLNNMSSILHGAGVNAAKAFKDLYDLWFVEERNKSQYLKTLEKEGVNLANMSSILHGARTDAAKTFKNLYDLWFDEKGNKTRYLKILEEEGINLSNMSSILGGAGNKAPKAFKNLYDLWFDKKGNKTQYLKTLEKEGINLTNMSSISHGAGANAAKAFKDLYDLWFDEKQNKTQYLKILEKEGMNLINISSILNGAGTNAAKALKELYNTFFDERGNKKQHLKHFIKNKNEEKNFTLCNLSGILGGAGTNAKIAFKKFHKVCFDDEGNRTEILDDFYKAGFRPRNLSSILCGTGIRASSNLKKLHKICFNEKRKKTKLLKSFYKAGFRPSDLCSILSGAADILEEFYNFCFVGKTKKYLKRFLEEPESFTTINLSEILHGAKNNVCSALKDFYDVCFDKAGNISQLLNDFFETRFTTSDLTSILSMAGNNAAFMLRNFHKSCFNKKNRLKHFLDGKDLFTPKYLSKMLHRVGINICTIFKKLHDVCFDKAGNKTDYLKNLVKNNPFNEVLNILHKNVRKAPLTLSDSLSHQQQDISRELL